MSKNKIVRGNDVEVVDGHHRGETGTVICNFKGGITASRPDGTTFWTPARHCQKKEAAGESGLSTTE